MIVYRDCLLYNILVFKQANVKIISFSFVMYLFHFRLEIIEKNASNFINVTFRDDLRLILIFGQRKR